MKACPGLRSGIGSLVESRAPKLVFPAIESMPRTPIRGWNPEGEGWGETDIPSRNRPASHDFHSLMLPSQDHRQFRRRHAPYPDTGPESG